jgi:hypothetical protein
MAEKIFDLIRVVENRVHPEQNTIGIDLIEENGLLKVHIPSSHILISSNPDGNFKLPNVNKPIIFYADNERPLKSASKEGSHFKKEQKRNQVIKETEEFEIAELNNELNKNQNLNKINELKKYKKC